MRLFVGISLAEELCSKAVSMQHEAQKFLEMKIVGLQNLHWTVKFLGDISEDKMPAIIETLDGLQNSIKPFSVTVQSVGVLSSERRPQTLYIGVSQPDSFVALLNAVDVTLTKIGFERDSRPLVPHLTLGRIKGVSDTPGFRRFLEQTRGVALGTMLIDRLTLFSSTLNSHGPIYREIYNVKLGE